VKLVEIFPGQRLKAVDDQFLIDGLQWVIAAQATMKGLDLILQCKARNDFEQLLKRVE
jgi:hypothetical protein